MLKINESYFDNEYEKDMENLNSILKKLSTKLFSGIPEDFEFKAQLYKAEEYRLEALEQWKKLDNKINDIIYKCKEADRKNRGFSLDFFSNIRGTYTKTDNELNDTIRGSEKAKLNAFLYTLATQPVYGPPNKLEPEDEMKLLAKKIMEEDVSERDRLLYGVYYDQKDFWCKTNDVINTGTSGVYKNGENIYNVYAQGKNKLWADIPYSERNYEKSACGATSIAIIASNVDPDITPIEAGQQVYKNAKQEFGTKVYDGSVTSYDTLKKTLDDYGINYTESYSHTNDEINEHLDKGQPIVICVKGNSVGDGEVRKGHFVTLLGKNDKGEIFLGDPAEDGSNSGYYDPSKILPAAHNWALFIDYDESQT